LFLEDIRKYREEKLASTGVQPVFPLWGLDTTRLARQMVAAGVRAFLTCVDPKKVPAQFAGQKFDSQLLRDLPQRVDPCGENGEFHTFAFAGPMFSEELKVKVGEVVERDGFAYADLIADESPARRAAKGAE
jgi:diphthamide synthase (EF-2-diphthine--ammonia ligase)